MNLIEQLFDQTEKEGHTRPDLAKLASCSDLSAWPEVAKRIKRLHEHPDLNTRLLATLLNAIFSSGKPVFLFGRPVLCKLLKLDPFAKRTTVNGTEFGRFKGFLIGMKYLAEDKDCPSVDRKLMGVYELVHPGYSQLLDQLNGKILRDQLRDNAKRVYQEGAARLGKFSTKTSTVTSTESEFDSEYECEPEDDGTDSSSSFSSSHQGEESSPWDLLAERLAEEISQRPKVWLGNRRLAAVLGQHFYSHPADRDVVVFRSWLKGIVATRFSEEGGDFSPSGKYANQAMKELSEAYRTLRSGYESEQRRVAEAEAEKHEFRQVPERPLPVQDLSQALKGRKIGDLSDEEFGKLF